MKVLLAIAAVSLFSAQSNATSPISHNQVNQKALEVLLMNAGQMTTQEGLSVARILSGVMVTSGDTHNKIENSCQFDKNDKMYNCGLTIMNADDNAETRTESMTKINYQLEAGKDGMPSKDPLFLTVEVIQAG